VSDDWWELLKLIVNVLTLIALFLQHRPRTDG